MKNNIQERGFDFSIRIAELVQFLKSDPLGFPLSEHLLSCGVEAGLACFSLMDSGDARTEKINHAKAHVIKIDYIIEMAMVAGYLKEEQCIHIRADSKALLELLTEA